MSQIPDRKWFLIRRKRKGARSRPSILDSQPVPRGLTTRLGSPLPGENIGGEEGEARGPHVSPAGPAEWALSQRRRPWGRPGPRHLC